jgi:hypothetical protein
MAIANRSAAEKTIVLLTIENMRFIFKDMQSMRRRNRQTSGLVILLAGLPGMVASSSVNAEKLSGIWKFEKSKIYGETRSSDESPPFASFTVQGDKAIFSQSCVVPFTPQDYFFSDVFQPMSKAGVREISLNAFLGKEFNLSLSKTSRVFHMASPARKCARPLIYFFQSGKRIIIPVGEVFYSYLNMHPALAAPKQSAIETQKNTEFDYRITPLPMDFDRYFSTCRLKLIDANRRPQTSGKCAPAFFPYVADPKSNDSLMKLVGNHDYAKGGSEYASGFSPPFQRKTAATFLVFPPMRQVRLVRVDDFEVVRDERRDIMSGVYLSIVNGKIIDQIDNCDFNGNYVCIVDGRPVAKLLDSGKIQRL